MIKGVTTFEERNANPRLDVIDTDLLYSDLGLIRDVYLHYKRDIKFKEEVDFAIETSESFARAFNNLFGELIAADQKRALKESSGKGLGK